MKILICITRGAKQCNMIQMHWFNLINDSTLVHWHRVFDVGECILAAVSLEYLQCLHDPFTQITALSLSLINAVSRVLVFPTKSVQHFQRNHRKAFSKPQPPVALPAPIPTFYALPPLIRTPLTPPNTQAPDFL